MTELVVSVRDGDEAATAYTCGAAVIDLKEPLRGTLGQPAATEVDHALRAVPAAATFSLACGELADGPSFPALADTSRIALAKAGPAGLGSVGRWRTHFERFCRGLPSCTRPVAVAYADFRTANSPPPMEVLSAASTAGAQGFLLDTFCKRNGTLFDWLSRLELDRLVAVARRLGIWVALAGSITRKDLRPATLLSARYIAMRGALCLGDRDSALSPHLVRSVRQELDALNAIKESKFSVKN